MNTEHDIDAFWGETAHRYVEWMKPWQTIRQGGFAEGDIQWFPEATLNVSVNCLDRHLADKANKAAIIWEGDTEEEQRTLTFAELHREVCRMANVLRKLGVGKGDRVGIYLPMIPEVAISMLACARIGAVHTVIFAGFSAMALQQRLEASAAKVLITADGYYRGGKFFTLKSQADEASQGLQLKTLLIKHSHTDISFDATQDHWWHELKTTVNDSCEPEE
ncbi:MAG: AMP-binding protein, partial [Prosthecobacter sp.]|nr:AMP-binding protein [Prosthecobacter sp.]